MDGDDSGVFPDACIKYAGICVADPKAKVSISRPNFIELCLRLTVEDEKAFESLFRRLALSVDWSIGYVTIGERARRASQDYAENHSLLCVTFFGAVAAIWALGSVVELW